MKRRKLATIVAPSNVGIDDLDGVQANGNATINKYSLDRMFDFYNMPAIGSTGPAAENLTDCASALFNITRNHTTDSIGPFTSDNMANEKTVSGIFAAQLQHLLSRFMFPDHNQQCIADILVATEQKLKSGGIDATLYKRTSCGLHPRILFEFAVADTYKEPQLFSYVNNSSTVIGDDLQLLLTGCVVTLFRDRPEQNKLRIYAYTKIRPPAEEDKDGEGARIAVIPIYKGAWTELSVKRLLRMVRNVMLLPMSDFSVPVGDLLPYERLRENVLIEGDEVYKMYDYRDTAGQGDRRPDGNIKFLGAEVVLQDKTGLCVIRYPLVKGDHTAELAVDFVGVLNHLHDVHTDGRLHMDIKLGNMVFNHSNGSESRLIDFDYSGPEGCTSYPSRYNQNIADGDRHKDAAGHNLGRMSHDNYAMMRAMQLFQPSKSALAGQWHEWSTRVGEGQLVEVAIELAERGHDFELELEGGVEVGGPTGSPPELNSLYKKMRSNEEDAELIV